MSIVRSQDLRYTNLFGINLNLHTIFTIEFPWPVRFKAGEINYVILNDVHFCEFFTVLFNFLEFFFQFFLVHCSIVGSWNICIVVWWWIIEKKFLCQNNMGGKTVNSKKSSITIKVLNNGKSPSEYSITYLYLQCHDL